MKTVTVSLNGATYEVKLSGQWGAIKTISCVGKWPAMGIGRLSRLNAKLVREIIQIVLTRD